MRSDKYQHNPGTAPATVSELQQISKPLRFDVGRRSASLTTTRESGDRPEGVKSRPELRVVILTACSDFIISLQLCVSLYMLENHMKHYKLLILLSLVLMPGFAHSALGPIIIVVTGTKTEQPVSESAVPVEIITSEQIRNSVATDVADIIEMHSSIEVARNGDYGKVTSLFIRGTESNHVVILIDGIKINPATLGGAALQNISPDIIERIEIVKGPRSSLYGSEAIGGVINIITRKSVEGSSARITVGVGENNTSKVGFSGYYGNDKLSSGITIEQFVSDGYPVQDASVEDHGFDNATINAYVDYKMDRSDIRLSHWSAKGNVEYYFFGDLDQDFENSSTALVWDFALSSNIKSNLRISSITDDIQQNQPNFLFEFDFAVTDRNEAEWKVDFLTDGGSTISLGLLSAEEEVEALSFGTVISEDTDISATYAIWLGNQGPHNYALAARQTDHEAFGKHDTWNLDYTFLLSDKTNIHFGAGTAFRAPDVTDRFGFGGNPNLEPETSENLEIGFTYAVSDNESFTVTYFDTLIDDLIGFDGVQTVNIDRAEITGVEANYTAARANWTYSLNLLLQDPQDVTNDTVLSRRAKKRIGFDLTYRQNTWQVGGHIRLVGERDNSGFDDIILDEYQLVNAFARYQLNKSSEISAKIENLFDEDYETASGFNTLGRTAYIEYSYSFGK